MTFYGSPWTSMEIHDMVLLTRGILWKSMNIHRSSWHSMVVHEMLWTFMTFYGGPWISMEVHEMS